MHAAVDGSGKACWGLRREACEASARLLPEPEHRRDGGDRAGTGGKDLPSTKNIKYLEIRVVFGKRKAAWGFHREARPASARLLSEPEHRWKCRDWTRTNLVYCSI